MAKELSREYDGRVNFAKLNVDDNTDSTTQYGIRTIPTLLIFQETEGPLGCRLHCRLGGYT